MNRIDTCFARLKRKSRKGLITFVTAGDPDEATSAAILNSLPESGADIIEIGIPFSDPVADGPVIQAASLRALESGMKLKTVLKMVQQFRSKNHDTPIVLMGYFNPIYIYGIEDFAADAARAGVDGLIIVDLPPEEDEELWRPAQKAGLHVIRLVAPTTGEKRLPKILQGAGGFLYYVSITGVTGTKSADRERVAAHIAQIRSKTNLPLAIGFGIRTPEDAAKMAELGDAIVVGSALVSTIAATPHNTIKDKISQQIQALAGAL